MGDGGEKGKVEVGTRDTRDDLTPITDIRGMGEALAVIKSDVREMKPEVKTTAKTVVELVTRQRVSENRIKGLETKTERLEVKSVELASPRPHDCINANKIVDLEEDSKKRALTLIEVKKDAAAVGTDVSELKHGQSKFIYWLLGAAFVVVGSIVGWYASYKVTTNEVQHLSIEQTKIRTTLEDVQKTTKNIPTKVDNAAQRLETAAQQIKTNGHDGKGIPLEDVWCILSEVERRRLSKRLDADKIPNQRCR